MLWKLTAYACLASALAASCAAMPWSALLLALAASRAARWAEDAEIDEAIALED